MIYNGIEMDHPVDDLKAFAAHIGIEMCSLLSLWEKYISGKD